MADGPADVIGGAAAARPSSIHDSYLGELQDAPGGARTTALEAGSTHHLPLLVLDGVVLFPGETLPLRLIMPSDRLSVRLALGAQPPLSRMLAAVCFDRGMVMQRVGCALEIVRASPDGVVAVAVARYRVEMLLESDPIINLQRAAVRVLEDASPPGVPPAVGAGAAAWGPWVYRRVDPAALAHRALRQFAGLLPDPGPLAGDALRLSFWISSQLPLDVRSRQQLLEAPSATERLLQSMDLTPSLAFYCGACASQLACLADVAPCPDPGGGMHFVNSHAVAHDIILFSSLSLASPEREPSGGGVVVEGPPVEEHSWFAGLAWEIVYCQCRAHLGWRFTPVGGGLRPPAEAGQPGAFYGVRRAAISNAPLGPHDQLQPLMGWSDDSGDERSDEGSASTQSGGDGGGGLAAAAHET